MTAIPLGVPEVPVRPIAERRVSRRITSQEPQTMPTARTSSTMMTGATSSALGRGPKKAATSSGFALQYARNAA